MSDLYIYIYMYVCRALLRKMTCKHKASYDSMQPCMIRGLYISDQGGGHRKKGA